MIVKQNFKKSVIILSVLCFSIPKKSLSQFYTIRVSHPAIQKDTCALDTVYSNNDFYDTLSDDTSIASNLIEKRNFTFQFSSPLRNLIRTSSFGFRLHPVTGQLLPHNGIDIRANFESVYSISDGQIEFVGYGSKEGLYTKVKFGELEFIYAHLSKIFVNKGDFIFHGQQLGITGESGRVTGPHLHLGIKLKGKYINPNIILNFINS